MRPDAQVPVISADRHKEMMQEALQEWDGHVCVCTGPRHPWAQVWPLLRHYD
jgi:hypothetical protein